jgi:hypothetical protein
MQRSSSSFGLAMLSWAAPTTAACGQRRKGGGYYSCRLVPERPNKGNKAIEREIISSFQVAQSLGFKGDFRAWEQLLRIADRDSCTQASHPAESIERPMRQEWE